MSDEPQGTSDAPEHQGSGGGGGFLSTTKGLVTGLTSLIVAVTGLVVACEKLAPDEKPAAAQTAVATTQGEATTTEESSGAEEEDYTGPLLYTGENTRLEWVSDENHWLLTVGDASGGYEDINPERAEDTMARLVGGNDYLRWPTEGGWLEASTDGKQSWVRVARITPEEPAQQQ